MKTNRFTLLIATMACFVAGGTLQASFEPSNGLVAHYPFDGNANDASGNGNHGTVNGASLGTDRHGISGKAYSFDGADDWVESTNIVSAYNKFTYSAWFSASYGTGNNLRTIVSKPRSSAGTGSRLGLPFSSLELGGGIFNGITLQSQGVAINSRINLNQWYFAAFTSDGAEMNLFVDGKLLDSNSNPTGDNLYSQQNLLIGKELHSNAGEDGQRYFQGSIDNVRIYNRALSAADVAALYEMERTKDSDSDGLYDAYETYLGTDPNVADTDGDGLNDGQEVTAGTNPKVSDKTVIDAVKVNSANFGLAPLSNLTATGATPHTNGWYYQPEWGWVWTNANVFPYVYRSPLGGKQAGWLYFREGSAPPYFHDYATGTWTKLGE